MSISAIACHLGRAMRMQIVLLVMLVTAVSSVLGVGPVDSAKEVSSPRHGNLDHDYRHA